MEQIIDLLSSSANLMGERDELVDYIKSLQWNKGRSVDEIKEGYEKFKEEKLAKELADIAEKHRLQTAALESFVDGILDRMIFDGTKLSDLLAPLELGWKERAREELALMSDLVPLLKKRAQGREISGLNAYE
jgi:type I restriction enzyme R subunit